MTDSFRLSRVFAQGWNAAHGMSANERDGLELGGIEARNPYASEPERSRWSEGFTKALGG
jgi:hypothetical protein